MTILTSAALLASGIGVAASGVVEIVRPAGNQAGSGSATESASALATARDARGILASDLAAAEQGAFPAGEAPAAEMKTEFVDFTPRVLTPSGKAEASTDIPAASPARARGKAPAKLPSGNYIAKDWVHGGSEVNCVMEVVPDATDPTMVHIHNFYGLGETVDAVVDITTGALSILPQRIMQSSSYGDVFIFPISYVGDRVQFYPSQPVLGSVDQDGVMTLSQWGAIVGYGDNAGMMLAAIDASSYHPANATMTASKRSDGKDSQITYPLLVEQASPGEMTIYNFGTTGVPVKARIASDNTVSVSPQFIANVGLYGAFHCFPINATTNQINKTDPIDGTVEGNTVRFSSWCAGSIMQDGLLALYIPESSMTTTFDLQVPKPVQADFEGSGTASSPWLIKSAADLTALSEASRKSSFAGKYFRQTADIDMSGVRGFVPVGTAKSAFNGTYDGDNHIISGLDIDGVGYHFQGLFGAVYTQGVVKNVILRRASLSGSGYYLGLLAGYSQGRIENCRVQGDIATTGMCVGGVTGRSYGPVRNCTFSGSASACGYVGGIVGFSYDEISSCRSDASVSLPQRLTDGASCAGGIAGLAQSYSTSREGKIKECRFSGTVTQGSGYGFAGGITGYAYAVEIDRCFNTGSVITTSAGGTEEAAGGIAGIVRDSKMTDCHNSGLISEAGASTFAGGLIGFITTSYSTIGGMLEPISVSNCYNSGQVLAKNRTAHAGVFGDEYILEQFPERPSDTAFTNVFSDNQATGLDDSAYGRPTSFFTASLPQGFGNSVWEAHSGLYPTLKAFSGTDEAAVASAAITFAEGESTRVMKKQASLAAPAGVRWYVMSGGELTDISQGLMKDGSTLSLRGVYANDTVVAAIAGQTSGRRFAINVVPKVFDGEGTAASPFLIRDKADFMKLHNAVMHYDHRGDFFLQTADVDFGLTDDFQGVAAGNHLREFAGSFDGGNHLIKGLKIAALRSNSAGQALQGTYNYGGLFHIATAESAIRNVVIDSSCSMNFYGYGAPVVGLTSGIVENCRNYAAVGSGTDCIGGIAGYVETTGSLSNCYNGADIAASGNYTGGIAGQNMGAVSVSQNDGDVSSAGKYTGGIAGASAGSILNSVNSGTVSGADYTGGIVGSNSAGYGLGDISGCLSSGLVKTASDIRGGIAGYSNGRGKVENNYFDASVNNMDGCSSLSQGFSGVSTSEMLSASAPEGLDAGLYSFQTGAYPSLKAFASETSGAARRSIWINFAKGEKHTNVIRTTDLSADPRIVWTLSDGKGNFSLAGGKLSVSVPEQEVAADTLTAVCDGRYVKVFPLKSIPAILEGSGSQTSPFLIRSASDLNLLASFMEKSGMDYEGYCFRVENDIEYSDETQFTPIARTGVQFQGDFDGNGKTISAISFVDETTKTGKNIGFFGTIGSKGSVRGLTLDGSIKAQSYTGSFAGLLYGRIAGCASKMNIDGKGGYAAGFAGRLYDGARIEDCVFSGTVGGSYTTNVNYAGGFAGQVDDGAVIARCVNKGTVGNMATTNGTTYTGTQYSGGIAAIALGTVAECRNEGVVKGRMHLGGILGRVGKTGRVYDCVNAAPIEALGGGYVGGIAPQTAGSGHSEIRRCLNTGALRGKSYVAGIIGAITNGMTVDSCRNEGEIRGFSSTAYGVGGVIGQMQSNVNYPSSVTNSCNVAPVYNEAQSTGGFAGKITAGTVRDCYNTGDVTVAKATDDQTSNGVGGFCGSFCSTAERIWNSGNVVSNIPSTGGLIGTGAMPIAKVIQGVNLGNVTASRVIPEKGYGAGGIWGGYGPVDIEDCYNYGDITAPELLAGINAGMWSNGNGGSTIRRSYSIGRVIPTSETPVAVAPVANISVNTDVDASLMRVDSTYFDKEVYTGSAVDSLGKGLTRAQLLKAALGGSYAYRKACLPTFAFMDSVPVAAFHAAHIEFADGDTQDNVSKEFHVGLMPGVEWTSSDELFIDADGMVGSRNVARGWVKATVAEPALEKQFDVDVKFSYVDSVEQDSREILRIEYYDFTGLPLREAPAGTPVIVKTVFTDGSSSVRKAVVAD